MSPHQVEPSAHVPKPISEQARSVLPNVRVLIGAQCTHGSCGPPAYASGVSSAPPRSGRPTWPRFLLGAQGWPYLLTPLIPVAAVLELSDASKVAIFVTSAIAVIPP